MKHLVLKIRKISLRLQKTGLKYPTQLLDKLPTSYLGAFLVSWVVELLLF